LKLQVFHISIRAFSLVFVLPLQQEFESYLSLASVFSLAWETPELKWRLHHKISSFQFELFANFHSDWKTSNSLLVVYHGNWDTSKLTFACLSCVFCSCDDLFL